ncbi:putative F-box/LRR-repeat protein At3g18150 [Rhodamnia argentea]|uniref:F-box/LRR-repeat protein At3g18150 n=1 Tax=Rhodamnia argentea TaxID=178133 RepID=A0ABM3H766_9MYRT|nr:putative F-box/LRR-repeat protein At3g18150 [Rhodamnia argentea]
MAGTNVHGVIHRKSSGDRLSRTEGNRAPPLRPRDLISALPDDVIRRIFSFLPLEDVVKTSVLSKRWRSTWTTTNHLVFHGFHGLRRRNHGTYTFDFPSLVDSVLIRCTSPLVKSFHITHFKYDEACRPKLDLWLRFTEACCVEDLRLLLITGLQFLYKLPPFLYCLSWLVRLEVGLCCFSLSTTIRWPCLKVLLIEYSELSDDILERIVRGSPIFESLELHWCRGVKNIIIDSTSAKELVLIGDSFSNTEKIWAPRLLSLRVSGRNSSMFRLDDISSLVEAKIDFDVPGDMMMCCDLLTKLLEKLREVPKITIGGWCLQILSVLELKGVLSPLSNCQNLILRARVCQWDLPGIAYMLQSSQCLEKLVIHLTGLSLLKFGVDKEFEARFNFDEEDLLRSRKGNFQCLAKHLKRVEIIGFANSFGSKHLLALIKFLIGDTLGLEKTIIKADLHAQHGQKRLETADLFKVLSVSRNVLSYRRASQNAEVIFKFPCK